MTREETVGGKTMSHEETVGIRLEIEVLDAAVDICTHTAANPQASAAAKRYALLKAIEYMDERRALHVKLYKLEAAS